MYDLNLRSLIFCHMLPRNKKVEDPNAVLLKG